VLWSCCFLLAVCWQRHGKTGAAADIVCRSNRTTVLANNFLTNGQSESGASSACLGRTALDEFVKYAFQFRLRYADAAIGNTNRCPARVDRKAIEQG